MDVERRWVDVRERVEKVARNAGRSDAPTIVAVSKTFGVDVIARAVAAGVTDLGENRAQELKDKTRAVGHGAVRWHFVGHLQTNKVRLVVGIHLIHSVDRFGLGEAIARRALRLGIVQDVLVEVNVSGEATKHGVEPERAIALAEEIAGLQGVRVRGLMTMPPRPQTAEDSRPHYARLRELRDRLVAVLPEAAELSMGMTRDFEAAVEEGATILRIGEAIFGARRL